MIKIICRLRYCNLPPIIPGLIQLPKGFLGGHGGAYIQIEKVLYMVKATADQKTFCIFLLFYNKALKHQLAGGIYLGDLYVAIILWYVLCTYMLLRTYKNVVPANLCTLPGLPWCNDTIIWSSN